MSYWIELADQDCVPESGWMLLHEPGGDLRFVIGRDSGPMRMSPKVIDRICEALYTSMIANGEFEGIYTDEQLAQMAGTIAEKSRPLDPRDLVA